ncbi:hypothetical protein C1645_719390 [Glomus cerebriforme]|uniref:NADAR domain-containing protein n=1 Tax=Glomus cerebriforme TaxID=658196 RepID=A0A397TSJ6_9GLOM|nr:hypothetical protein C1645_719390 [Glomus cerebriforme]
MEKSVISFYGRGREWGEFSNFFEAEILIDGETWPTVEHYFQAQKFPSQPEIQQKIRNFKTPGQAKNFGVKHSGLRSDWEQVKDNVMHEALRAKFSQHRNLRKLLLSTGDAELVESSPTDSYWGNAARKDGSEGFNKLGLLLMEIRKTLASDEE